MSSNDFYSNLIFGAINYSIAKTFGAPFDFVKFRFQLMPEMIKSQTLEKPYTGIINCFRSVYRDEGIKAFWQGNLTSIIRYLPNQIINFTLKDTYKKLFQKSSGYNFWMNITSGALAGSTTLALVYSLEYTRVRLIMDRQNLKMEGKKQFNGIIDVYRKTLATDGIVGLYRGFWVSCFGIFIYRGLYFGLYDSFKRLSRGNTNIFFNFLLGWIVTITAGVLSYPLNTIQGRMMMRSIEPIKYKGAIDCAKQIMKNEGIRAFFRGNGFAVLKSIAGAGALVGYDMIKDSIQK